MRLLWESVHYTAWKMRRIRKYSETGKFEGPMKLGNKIRLELASITRFRISYENLAAR